MFKFAATNKIAILIGFIIVVAFNFAQTTYLQPFKDWRTRLELFAYDVRLNFFLKEKEKDERIVIVDIDERSLVNEGRWPWSRKKIAQLTQNLSDAGAIVISFDVIFSERERNPVKQITSELNAGNKKLVEELNKFKNQFDYDTVLANAFQEKDIVLGYITYGDDKFKPVGQLPAALVTDVEDISKLNVPKFRSYTANIKSIQSAAINAGYFTLQPDIDGVIRRLPLVQIINDEVYSSLSFETFRVFNLIENVKIYTEKIEDEHYFSGVEAKKGKVIPTDGIGNVIVPFRGRSGSYPYISATDVLTNNFKPEIVENKIVLVGTTAIALFDMRVVPVQRSYPGVEVHANVITALMDDNFPVRPPWAPGANLVFMLVAGILLAVFLPVINPLLQFMLSTALLIGMVSVNFWFWNSKGIELNLVMPLLLVVVLSVFNFLYGFIFESISRNKLRSAFGQYIPPELVNQMDTNLTQYGFEGETREMTVLFCDVMDFTSISEKLTAADLKTLLNEFLTPMTEVIFYNRGTIDKYIGDLIMALWGAPLPNKHHARDAVRSAIQMLDTLKELNSEYVKRDLPVLFVGIGINTGEMNVGDMGSKYRRAYTVIGDSVNLASRLEGLTRYFGMDILISEATCNQLDNEFDVMRVGTVKVKGKNESVRIYAVLHEKGKTGSSDLKQAEVFEEFLVAFENRVWKRANDLLNELHIEYGHRKLFSQYREQLEHVSSIELDDNWKGEITFLTK